MEEIKIEKSSISHLNERCETYNDFYSRINYELDQLRTEMGIPECEYKAMIAKASESINQLKKGDYSYAETYISLKLKIDRNGFEGFDDLVKALLAQGKILEFIYSRSR